MELKQYIQSFPINERRELKSFLAKKLGISDIYLRMMAFGHRPLKAKFAIALEKATKGAVTRFDIAPQVYKK